MRSKKFYTILIAGFLSALNIPKCGLAYYPDLGYSIATITAGLSLRDTTISGDTIASDTPTLVSSQFLFTEGPAPDKEGNIYFTDQPNNTIWKYDTNGRLSLFMDSAGRSNGMYFDQNGILVSCADEHNELWAIHPDKKITVLLKDFNGKTFNGPNDVWVNHQNGDIYFTDPYYPRDYWKKNHTHLKEQRVYFLAKNKKRAVIVDGQLKKPNGIIGTPDGAFLYVADIEDDKTFKYQIKKDGSLYNKILFVNQGSDGMTMDEKGNVYLVGKGVTVYNAEGKKIKHFDIPEDWTGNICFGGKNNDILFITASKSIYIVHMNVKGMKF